MTDYFEAMHELNDAIYKAVRAADNEDGAPVEALLNVILSGFPWRRAND